jgi:hypothetical protein
VVITATDIVPSVAAKQTAKTVAVQQTQSSTGNTQTETCATDTLACKIVSLDIHKNILLKNLVL